jgi:hypothetical protein
MAKRIYSAGMRAFEITLSEASGNSRWSWTVERVIETSRGGRAIVIPTMDRIVATTEDEALARACDRIDKWLLSNLPSPGEDRTMKSQSFVVHPPIVKPPPACPTCGRQRTRIVGQSGQPPLVHCRCEQCGHLSSRERGDE